jgi:hypothetical protein
MIGGVPLDRNIARPFLCSFGCFLFTPSADWSTFCFLKAKCLDLYKFYYKICGSIENEKRTLFSKTSVFVFGNTWISPLSSPDRDLDKISRDQNVYIHFFFYFFFSISKLKKKQ